MLLLGALQLIDNLKHAQVNGPVVYPVGSKTVWVMVALLGKPDEAANALAALTMEVAPEIRSFLWAVPPEMGRAKDHFQRWSQNPKDDAARVGTHERTRDEEWF